jgi:hypothetical protein
MNNDICMPVEDWNKFERSTRIRCYRNMSLALFGGAVISIVAWVFITPHLTA